MQQVKHPAREDLEQALAAAGSAHHAFEQNYFGGGRDELWAGWAILRRPAHWRVGWRRSRRWRTGQPPPPRT